jgi:ABC-type oligopeptide transport system substrate-binding subunit
LCAMTQRLALAIATLAAGAGLLATAALSSSAPASSDGILEVGTTGVLGSVDPALAYGGTSWEFEDATGASLFRGPDANGRVAPEVVKRFTVSKNGRVYRFVLRKSYRFSDGQPVRAQSFAYAIQRALNRALRSPGGSFVSDPNGVNIVGAKAYAAGTAGSVSGVHASGLNLTINLVRANPNLPAVLAMPFFQAASSKLPLAHEVVTVRQVGDLPTAGPYTWSYNAPYERADIVKNPYYRGTRGRHVAGVELEMRLDRGSCFQQTQESRLDIGCVPPDQAASLAQQYGVSRRKPVGSGRFWVRSACELPVLFNFRRSLFAGNTPLRQAVNWAVDRTALAGQVTPYAQTPWTHLLPPDLPGSVTAARSQPYSLRANLAKARQLAAGHLGDGTIRVAYQSAGSYGPAAGKAVRQALVGLGFDASKVEMRGYAGFDLYLAAGTRGTTLDLVVGVGLCPDTFGTPDAASLIGQVLIGDGLGDFSPGSSLYNKAFRALTTKLKGKARVRALGRFDVQVMKNFAPVAVVAVTNDLTLFSDRVDPSSLKYSPASRWSFTALRLK